MNPHVHRVVGVIHQATLELESARTIASAADIDELDAAIANLKAASAAIVVREGQRAEAVEKRVRWGKLVPECRRAKTELQKLERQYEASHTTVAEARNVVIVCEAHLGQAMQAKPRAEDYPTEKEIREHTAQVERFRVAFEEAKQKLRGIVEAQGQVSRDLLKARETFQPLE
jgi:hypothetical protein